MKDDRKCVTHDLVYKCHVIRDFNVNTYMQNICTMQYSFSLKASDLWSTKTGLTGERTQISEYSSIGNSYYRVILHI
jgi:hypothetical protein